MRLAAAEVEWVASLSDNPTEASADQDNCVVGTGLCRRSRERAGSRRERVSGEADYMGSPEGVDRSTFTDSKQTVGDCLTRGAWFSAAADKIVGRTRFAPGARSGHESIWRQYQLRRSARRRRNYRARCRH